MEQDDWEALVRTMRLAIAQASMITGKHKDAHAAVTEELESIELALRLLLRKLEDLNAK